MNVKFLKVTLIPSFVSRGICLPISKSFSNDFVIFIFSRGSLSHLLDLLTVIHNVKLSCLFHTFGFEAHLAVGFIFLVIIFKVFFPNSFLIAWWFSKFSHFVVCISEQSLMKGLRVPTLWEEEVLVPGPVNAPSCTILGTPFTWNKMSTGPARIVQ